MDGGVVTFAERRAILDNGKLKRKHLAGSSKSRSDISLVQVSFPELSYGIESARLQMLALFKNFDSLTAPISTTRRQRTATCKRLG